MGMYHGQQEKMDIEKEVETSENTHREEKGTRMTVQSNGWLKLLTEK